jgi:hypothetical protein
MARAQVEHLRRLHNRQRRNQYGDPATIVSEVNIIARRNLKISRIGHTTIRRHTRVKGLQGFLQLRWRRIRRSAATIAVW